MCELAGSQQLFVTGTGLSWYPVVKGTYRVQPNKPKII